jgi:hypothetical protein
MVTVVQQTGIYLLSAACYHEHEYTPSGTDNVTPVPSTLYSLYVHVAGFSTGAMCIWGDGTTKNLRCMLMRSIY